MATDAAIHGFQSMLQLRCILASVVWLGACLRLPSSLSGVSVRMHPLRVCHVGAPEYSGFSGCVVATKKSMSPILYAVKRDLSSDSGDSGEAVPSWYLPQQVCGRVQQRIRHVKAQVHKADQVCNQSEVYRCAGQTLEAAA